MSIKIVVNGAAVTLPDLPAATLERHPYAYIRYHWGENTEEDEIYLTTVSVPVLFDPSQDALVAEAANYVTHLAVDDQWVEVESGDSFSVCEDVADFALSWANFDVLTIDSGDLYFADSTAAGPAAEAGMRYITDDNDRLLYVSFGADIVCDGQSCTGYTGSVPEGYASLEAWYLAQADQLHKWTVVDGDLTLDETAVAPAPDRTVEPVERGGTGATTAAGARQNLGAAADWVDLWENASPASAFEAKTLTIEGLDDCDEFDFEFAGNTDASALHVHVFAHVAASERGAEKGYSAHFSYVTSSWGVALRQRNFYIKAAANTVRYATAWAGGAVTGNDNSLMIPVRIRGRARKKAADAETMAVLGRAVLGKMILGNGG